MLTDEKGHHLAVGFIVLIGLALSLAIVFLIVAAGVLLGMLRRRRRRREGYVPAPSPTSVAAAAATATAVGGPGATTETGENVRRIPPEELLGGLTAGRAAGRGWASQKAG